MDRALQAERYQANIENPHQALLGVNKSTGAPLPERQITTLAPLDRAMWSPRVQKQFLINQNQGNS